ncbi:MAG: hypothetical protein KBC78_00425 [Candidatus Pacebacteria bacterium]|nr:hypothetical protein [Candidatus Paceibacterota bacterium]
MSSSFKNVLVILVLITLGFVAYYVIFAKDEGAVALGDNPMVSPELYASTQLFIEYRLALDKVKIDTAIFENPLFTSYQNFTLPVSSQATSRNNPFAQPSSSNLDGEVDS